MGPILELWDPNEVWNTALGLGVPCVRVGVIWESVPRHTGRRDLFEGTYSLGILPDGAGVRVSVLGRKRHAR